MTILEELTEIRRSSSVTEPYVLMMLDQMRSMGPRLENGEPLPPEFQIHWFDDLEDPIEDDWSPRADDGSD